MTKEVNGDCVSGSRARRTIEESDSRVLVLSVSEHQEMAGIWIEDRNISNFDLLFHKCKGRLIGL